MMTPFLLIRLEDAAGVRPASGDAEVTGGDLIDTCSSSWRTRPACPGQRQRLGRAARQGRNKRWLGAVATAWSSPGRVGELLRANDDGSEENHDGTPSGLWAESCCFSDGWIRVVGCEWTNYRRERPSAVFGNKSENLVPR
jgi:hypothetical protein